MIVLAGAQRFGIDGLVLVNISLGGVYIEQVVHSLALAAGTLFPAVHPRNVRLKMSHKGV